MFEPRMFAKAKCEDIQITAINELIDSGKAVINATRTAPATALLTPRTLDTQTALSKD